MIRSKLALALALSTALTTLSVAAQADDGFEAGSFMVRARGLAVLPQVRNTPLDLATGSALSGGQTVKIDNVGTPEVDFSYFFTPNLSAELIAATFRTGLHTNNTTAPDLGSSWLLPPTLTAQWHFFPKGVINPYVGAGLNYTFFYNSDGANTAAGNANRLNLSNSLGYALQAGVDYNITGRWYANLDVKYIFLSTNASEGGSNGTFPVTSHVDVNPLLLGAGIGYRF